MRSDIHISKAGRQAGYPTRVHPASPPGRPLGLTRPLACTPLQPYNRLTARSLPLDPALILAAFISTFQLPERFRCGSLEIIHRGPPVTATSPPPTDGAKTQRTVAARKHIQAACATGSHLPR